MAGHTLVGPGASSGTLVKTWVIGPMLFLATMLTWAETMIDATHPYAYGANIGWIRFEQTQGQPRMDFRTGNLSGYVNGANVGWFSLSNEQEYARTARLDAGPGLIGPPASSPMDVSVSGVTQTTRFYWVQCVVPLSE